MTIALQRSGSMQGSGFVHGFMGVFAGDRWRVAAEEEVEHDSCSSSSIGKDSDEECGESDVQSTAKGPLDTMDDLEEVLPTKKGISKFYHGKAKSFTSLADASSVPSIKDLSKPENPYSRKRKILLARANSWEKNHSYHPKDNESEISKRPANSNASAVDTGLSFGCHRNKINSEDSRFLSSSPSSNLPPLHPHGKRSTCNVPLPPERNTPWRTLSLSDLQFAAATSSN